MARVDSPQSFCRLGIARGDVTPPVGFYHRMWGAATHDRATGIHRPLTATVLALEALDPTGSPGLAAAQAKTGSTHDAPENQPRRQVVVSLDHCLLWTKEMQRFRNAVCQATGVRPDELQVTFTHTHAAGLVDHDRSTLPGGELIAAYFNTLVQRTIELVHSAVASLEPGWITYGAGHCELAQNRDFWDASRGEFVCGFNPGGPTDATVLVARLNSADGQARATLVNYACHPTTLAWDNTLISPDFVGSMRELIERATGVPCLFLQGASGDLGPREGFVGDVEVADRNGRQLGYAALAAIESLPPDGTSFDYAGAVVSGATIGTWQHRPLDAASRERKSRWRSRLWTVALDYRTDLPNQADTAAALKRWQAQEQAALARDDQAEARDCRAQVERMTRQLVRITSLPAGKTFAYPVVLWQTGDAYWLMLEAEHYNVFQRELRSRFPNSPIVLSTLTNGWRLSYLPTREAYGKGIYQEIIALLSPGCLETLLEAVAKQIQVWQSEDEAGGRS